MVFHVQPFLIYYYLPYLQLNNSCSSVPQLSKPFHVTYRSLQPTKIPQQMQGHNIFRPVLDTSSNDARFKTVVAGN